MSFPTHYRLAFLCICLLRSEPNLIHPPRPQITKTQIWSIVTSTPPPKYPLTSENFLETNLASDGLSSALSLPLVQQFFIEIWTTSVSHSPPTDAYGRVVTSAPLSQTSQHTKKFDGNELSWWRAFYCVVTSFVTTRFHWDLSHIRMSAPPQTPQTQIGPGSDVNLPLPNELGNLKTWWRWA